MKTIHYKPDTGLKQQLRKAKNEFFAGKSEKGDWRLYSKTIIGYTAWFILYILIIFSGHEMPIKFLFYGLLGTVLPFIGFTTMHDACHGAYSKKEWVNTWFGYSLEFTGAVSTLWKIKHNQIHHSRVNINEEDDDISPGPFLRFSPHQVWKPVNRIQPILVLILFYPLLYIFWIAVTDFTKYFRKKIGNTDVPFTKREHRVFWISKVSYIFVFFVFPSMVFGFWNSLFGFLIMSAVCGTILSHVFQPAHVTTLNEFIEPDKDGNLSVSEVELQLVSTSNFATNNRFLTWYMGGLNFQVTHHLFPRVSHVHYKELQKKIDPILREHGFPCKEHKTFFSAIVSHYRHLINMGKKPELSTT
jgi:linoleoyl-CoA desaturase